MIELAQLDGGKFFIDELDCIEIALQRNVPVVITLSFADTEIVLFESTYYPYSNKVDLDILEVILNNALYALPNGAPGEEDINLSTIALTMTIRYVDAQSPWDTSNFKAMVCHKNLTKRMTDVDSMSVPANYKVPVTLYNDSDNLAEENIDNDVYLVHVRSHIKAVAMSNITLNPEVGCIATGHFDIASLPVSKGVPFYLSFKPAYHLQHQAPRPTVVTPFLTVVEGQFEQYLFLNKYGAWDNIAMSGDFKFVPEYDIENALHNGGHVKGHAVMDEIYEQNSGYLSRKTVKALSELLLSDEIYHLEDGEWKRIVIDEPNISLSRFDSVHSLTFRWTYAENDE